MTVGEVTRVRKLKSSKKKEVKFREVQLCEDEQTQESVNRQTLCMNDED